MAELSAVKTQLEQQIKSAVQAECAKWNDVLEEQKVRVCCWTLLDASMPILFICQPSGVKLEL